MTTTVPTKRFDYIAYDQLAQEKQAALKRQFVSIENFVQNNLPPSGWKEKLLDHLEYAYMAAGKAIRDEQLQREGAAELQEERSAS